MAGMDVMKKGPWSSEEDHKLIAYIRRYGIWNWNHMASPAGLSRSGKSCRLRWMNYLRPNLRHGNFTQEEEEIIIKWQQAVGNKWSLISSKLEGRTDNEVKNYWNTRLKKRFVAEEDSAEMKSNFEESMNSSSALTNRWIKEEAEPTTSDDTTSDMLVDSVAEMYWNDDELYTPIMTSMVEHDDFESMLMVSSCSNYALQDSFALEQYYIDDNLWED